MPSKNTTNKINHKSVDQLETHGKLRLCLYPGLRPRYFCPKCSGQLVGLYSRCHVCYKNKCTDKNKITN